MPEFKAALEYFNRMYKEGMFDESFKTNPLGFDNWYNDYMVQGKFFVTTAAAPSRAQMGIDDAAAQGINLSYAMAPPPINQAVGKARHYAAGNPMTLVPLGISINAKIDAAKLPKAQKFLDILYSPEFEMFSDFGLVGEDYTITDGVMTHKGGDTGLEIDAYCRERYGKANYIKRFLNFLDNKPKYGIDIGSKLIKDFYGDSIASGDPYYVRLPVPVKVGDLTDFMAYKDFLGGYVLTTSQEFVFGDRPFTDWDQFVEECRAMGSDEYKAFMQTYVDYGLGKDVDIEKP